MVNESGGDSEGLQPTEGKGLPAQQVEKITGQILDLVHRVAFEPKCLAQRGKLLPSPFDIDEELIGGLERCVCEHFSKLAVWSGEPVTSISVRFPDLSEETVTSFDEFRAKACTKRDPERVTLLWKGLLREPLALTAEVEVRLTTEKRLETEELGLLEYHLAAMEFKVGGPSHEWVDPLYEEILAYLSAAKIGGMYKPLLIFRNKHIVHICGITIGLIAHITTVQALGRVFRNPEKQTIAESILKTPDIESKFDEFVRYILVDSSSLLEPILLLGIGAFALILGIVVGLLALPHLVPRSCIKVGLAKYRYIKYQNAFKFVIFTVIVSGIIVPLVLKLIFK